MAKTKLTDFHFNLPKELIAQHPLQKREQSRMMVIKQQTQEIIHDHFFNIANYLNPGDLIIVNDTKVLPFRFNTVKKETKGKVEVTLVKQTAKLTFAALINKKVNEGTIISFDSQLEGTILARNNEGNYEIVFNCPNETQLLKTLETIGKMPLPPYIKRTNENFAIEDKDRYQTIYASKKGAIAAPTAGLHFSDSIINNLKNKGIEIASVTLEVGLGTFIPIKNDYIQDHPMHSETFELTKETINKIRAAQKRDNKILCIGTTTTRVLESIADETGNLKPQKGSTNIYIYPPYKFKFVKNLLTNFHFPDSTLILLIAALIGKDKLLKAYKTAIAEKYRFFSYGDCMLILD